MIDPGEVVQRERPPQPLDPPAVALLGERVPVEERIAPVLPQGAELVRRCAGHGTLQEELRMGQMVDAVLGDIDRDVPDQPDPALACVLAQRRPLAVEANLVGDAPARPLPVCDPVRVRTAVRRELTGRDWSVRLGQETVPGSERGGGCVG